MTVIKDFEIVPNSITVKSDSSGGHSLSLFQRNTETIYVTFGSLSTFHTLQEITEMRDAFNEAIVKFLGGVESKSEDIKTEIKDGIISVEGMKFEF